MKLSKQQACPIKKLNLYKSNSELFLAWVKFIILETLGFSKLDSSIHTRRSMQKTFLSWVANFYKWESSSRVVRQKWKLEESGLSYFWKESLLSANRESKIADLDKLIWDFQATKVEYENKSKRGDFGILQKYNTILLSLTNAIPETKNDLPLIINVAIVVLISFRMSYGHNNINAEEEKKVLLWIIKSIIGSFLILQKRYFDISGLAFMNNTYVDKYWKQILPIEFIWNDIENLKWQFTQEFKENVDELASTDVYSTDGYTKMITSCPAATNWLLPLLTKNIFDILYEGPRSENKNSTI